MAACWLCSLPTRGTAEARCFLLHCKRSGCKPRRTIPTSTVATKTPNSVFRRLWKLTQPSCSSQTPRAPMVALAHSIDRSRGLNINDTKRRQVGNTMKKLGGRGITETTRQRPTRSDKRKGARLRTRSFSVDDNRHTGKQHRRAQSVRNIERRAQTKLESRAGSTKDETNADEQKRKAPRAETTAACFRESCASSPR